MKNTDKIISMSKEISANKINNTTNILNQMIKNNDKITFYAVAKAAGVSTQFLYKNKDLRKLIETNRK